MLEGAGEPRARTTMWAPARDLATTELDPPPRGQIEARHQIDERGLAGAVRADQAHHLALVQLERDVVERLHALERARHGERPQHSLRLGTIGGLAQGLSLAPPPRGPPGPAPGPPGAWHFGQIFWPHLGRARPADRAFLARVLLTRGWR